LAPDRDGFVAGLVMDPRGIGTMAAMMIVGQLVGRVDMRLLVAVGMGLNVRDDRLMDRRECQPWRKRLAG
jgi:hypothetical protein